MSEEKRKFKRFMNMLSDLVMMPIIVTLVMICKFTDLLGITDFIKRDGLDD